MIDASCPDLLEIEFMNRTTYNQMTSRDGEKDLLHIRDQVCLPLYPVSSSLITSLSILFSFASGSSVNYPIT